MYFYICLEYTSHIVHIVYVVFCIVLCVSYTTSNSSIYIVYIAKVHNIAKYYIVKKRITIVTTEIKGIIIIQ